MSAKDTVSLQVRNIGGIDETHVEFSEGVTLLSGANASNKSSLLRALTGVLGGPTPPLKSDADSGSVTLQIGDEEYQLQVEREDDDPVVTERTPYLDDSDLIELFVALTETNPIRRAVLAGEDLYPHLMEPVDTAEIEADIKRLQAEQRSIADQLDEINDAERRLAELRDRRATVADDLAATEEQLADLRADIDELEAAVAADDEESDALSEKRARRSDLTARICTQEAALEELTAERESVRERLASFDVDADTDIEQLDERLDTLHRRKQAVADTLNTLSSVIELNTQLLERPSELPDSLTDENVVGELHPGTGSVTCWTCGSTVERAAVADQMEAIEELLREKRNERDELTERIQGLTERKQQVAERQSELAELRRRETELDEEIRGRERTLEQLRSDRRAVERDIEELRSAADEPSDEQQALAEKYATVGDLEYERGALAGELEELDEEMAQLETKVADRPALEERQETVEKRLTERRQAVERREAALVETFNEEMTRTLAALAYDRIERIWLERVESSDGRSFRLNVVRATEDDTAYADTVDSLSKSEREIVGLVVALTGYLVHEVHERVPFIIIDAIEMFDADRIDGLVETFGEHATNLLVALLPEQGMEVDGYETVSPAERQQGQRPPGQR
ncbi:archaea-specific SMC-related protein [Halosegnis sp.]|uniref:archaea-specific SMC-related protein n=1 Tax=Halosegnis sp. TaxID=2864959 RepID=UPI0035D52515